MAFSSATSGASVRLVAHLLQGELAAFVIALLEPVKAVAAIAGHLASLAHIAELLGELKPSPPALGNAVMYRIKKARIP